MRGLHFGGVREGQVARPLRGSFRDRRPVPLTNSLHLDRSLAGQVSCSPRMGSEALGNWPRRNSQSQDLSISCV